MRLGLDCKAQTDSYIQLMEVALLRPGDVVVGISQSGSSVDPVLTLKQAKQNGVSTICITGNSQSPITEFADITLLSVAREVRAEAIASRLAQDTILDALYVIMAWQNMKTAVKNEKYIWDALLPKML
jgi:DNA-binding MurR/RpiR family transcriptional regulator